MSDLLDLSEEQRFRLLISSVTDYAIYMLDRQGRVATWNPGAERFKGYAADEIIGEHFSRFFTPDDVEAGLLLMAEVGFLPPGDARFAGTLALIEQRLRRGRHLFRYAAADDFGTPSTAFNVCTFWYIDALARVGRAEEARELFGQMLASRNSVGLLSEDIDPATGEHWGNYPQTYSLVGIVNAATRLSRGWEAFA